MIGNTTFPLDAAIGAEIVEILRAYPDGTVFLTRGSPGFDQFIIAVAPIIGRRCLSYPAGGGTDNLIRDAELVRDADEVLGFFDPATMHREDTGTAMVIEKALTAKKPTRVYTAVDGTLVWAGETDKGPSA